MHKGVTQTRKMMTLHKTLYPRDDIDYMSQEKEEKEDSSGLRFA